jgi:hypothetical protein
VGDLDEVHLIRVGLPRFRDDGDFGWGQWLMTISQGLPISVGNDGTMGVSHELIVGLQDTMRCIVHGVGNRVNVDPAAQVVGTKEAPQEVGVKMFAQFIAVCRRSKWSRHLTNSPRLALLATAGSNAACKILSACSHAFWCRKFRKN